MRKKSKPWLRWHLDSVEDAEALRRLLRQNHPQQFLYREGNVVVTPPSEPDLTMEMIIQEARSIGLSDGLKELKYVKRG